jgi:hypothetical protein
MAEELRVQFRIRSEDPNVPTPVISGQIQQKVSDLQALLRKKYPVEAVRIDREATFPLDPVTIAVGFAIAVAGGFSGGIGKNIADDVYDWLKDEWTDIWAQEANLSILQKPEGQKPEEPKP